MAKFTDEQLLQMMTEAIDEVCVAEDGDDYTKKGYRYNGAWTDYGMDVKKLKGIKLEKE